MTSDVSTLARAKSLEASWLREEIGLEDVPGGGVSIPYYDACGEELFRRTRDVPNARDGRRFDQPFGVQLRAYGLWKLAELDGSTRLHLCEGESDCWAIWSGGLPALGLPGAQMYGRLRIEDLAGVETLIICPDGDDAGRQMLAGVLDRLRVLGYAGTVYAIELPFGIKDVSDFRCSDPSTFAARWRVLVGAAKLVCRPPSVAERNGDGGDAEDDTHLTAEDWPGPPAPPAFAGLAGDVARAIDPETEADAAAVLAQFLVAFGSACGRTAFRAVGKRRHHGNLFAVLVGATSRGRKGTAWDWVESLFKEAEPHWVGECLQSGLSSGEGLIQAVRDKRMGMEKPKKGGEPVEVCVDEGVADKRLLVVEEEFGATLRVMARDGNILSATLRQAWDGGRLRTLTRQSPLKATDAHVSVLGHITRQELTKLLQSNDQANGFANRILWLAVRRSKLLPDGGREPAGWAALVKRVAESLRLAAHYTGSTKGMERTARCTKLWREEYPRLTADRPGAFGLVTSRAEAQVLRLSLLYALLDGSDEIDEPHLHSALALWDYAERSCRWIFGMATGSPDADEILEALRAAGENGMSGRDIHALFGRNRTAAQLKQALAILADGKLARSETTKPGPAGGRPAQRWYATAGTHEQTEQTN